VSTPGKMTANPVRKLPRQRAQRLVFTGGV
jgi:hypothetical protein